MNLSYDIKLRMPHHRTITDRRGRRSLQYLITFRLNSARKPTESRRGVCRQTKTTRYFYCRTKTSQNPVGADSISARNINLNLHEWETCESPIRYLITLYPSPHDNGPPGTSVPTISDSVVSITARNPTESRRGELCSPASVRLKLHGISFVECKIFVTP